MVRFHSGVPKVVCFVWSVNGISVGSFVIMWFSQRQMTVSEAFLFARDWWLLSSIIPFRLAAINCGGPLIG
jgi:hypothetical protein